jgi:hypothetical protein
VRAKAPLHLKVCIEGQSAFCLSRAGESPALSGLRL